jgi:electron transfer flavoprotein alpha/beta subunit
MKEVFDMNIIVLLKQVPDPKGYIRIKEDGTLDREGASAKINPYDKNSLQAALEIRKKYNAKITAVSMGPSKAEEALREALAMGADEAMLLSDERLAGSDTLATSHALHKVIKKLGHYDLILCGMEATDGNTGQVGPEVAEHLGIPQLTYIEKFEIKEDIVEARRMLEGGYEKLKVKLPALLTITNTANEPGSTTFSGIIKAVKKYIPVWSASYIEADENKIGSLGSPTKIKKIEKTVSQRNRFMVKGETVDAVVDNLLNKLKEDGVSLGD